LRCDPGKRSHRWHWVYL